MFRSPPQPMWDLTIHLPARPSILAGTRSLLQSMWDSLIHSLSRGPASLLKHCLVSTPSGLNLFMSASSGLRRLHLMSTLFKFSKLDSINYSISFYFLLGTWNCNWLRKLGISLIEVQIFKEIIQLIVFNPSKILAGAYSDSRGIPAIRKEVADFIGRRDGYPRW